MKARVTFLGHSVHQMLIVLPLGLLVGAIIFDVVGLLVGGVEWANLSYWLIAVGVMSGLLAAVFGFADWTKIPADTRAKRIGTIHGLGNVGVVALFAISWFLRGGPAEEPGGAAYLFSFLGGGLAMITSWLGGELVARLGVGVDEGAHVDAPSSLSGRPAGGSAIGK
jgi:uncharacterized membrane protein